MVLATAALLAIFNTIDLNGDGRIDGGDLSMILSAWGGGIATTDLNGDGHTDGGDLSTVLNHFGEHLVLSTADGAWWIVGAGAKREPSPFVGCMRWMARHDVDPPPITYLVIDVYPLPTIAGRQFWRRSLRDVTYDPPPAVWADSIDERTTS